MNTSSQTLCSSSQTYLSHRHRLMAMARAGGCDEHDAEDVVQDMFATLVRVGRLEELNDLPETARTAMLRRRLKCALMNRWRDRQRQCREARQTCSLSELEEHDWHPSVKTTPATEHDRHWALQKVAGAITLLRDECGGQWRVVEGPV